jgi:hypothetical protein
MMPARSVHEKVTMFRHLPAGEIVCTAECYREFTSMSFRCHFPVLSFHCFCVAHMGRSIRNVLGYLMHDNRILVSRHIVRLDFYSAGLWLDWIHQIGPTRGCLGWHHPGPGMPNIRASYWNYSIWSVQVILGSLSLPPRPSAHLRSSRTARRQLQSRPPRASRSWPRRRIIRAHQPCMLRQSG